MRATSGVARLTRLGGLAIVFAASLFISAAAGFNFDEVWFLQVVNRVVGGDTLYRDVFYLSTPLPVYATALAARVFGSTMLVEKAVTACAFVAELAFADALARACGVTRRARWGVWLALFVYTQHFPNPPYRTIGNAFMLAAFWALAEWSKPAQTVRTGLGDVWLAIAGAFAGWSFAAMPNLGALALVSGAVVIGVRHAEDGAAGRDTLRRLSWLAAACACVACLFLTPVLFSGSLPAMLDYTLLNKGPYLRDVGVSWSSEVRALLRPFSLRDPSAFARVYRGLHVLLIPVTAVMVVAAGLRAPRGARAQATAVGLLVVSAVFGAYPRMNRFHLSYASPAIIVGLAYCSVRLLAGWPRVRAVALALVIVWTVPGAVLTLAGALRSARSATTSWSSLPHLEGVRIDRRDDARIRVDVAKIRAAPPAFLIGPRATLDRLVAGIRNPTPFDEFSQMGFGTHGQDDVISRIRAGELRPVCLQPETVSPPPAALLDFVRSLTPAEDLGVCRLYR